MKDKQMLSMIQGIRSDLIKANKKINELEKHIKKPIRVEFPYRAPGYDVKCPTCDHTLYETYADYHIRRNRPQNLMDKYKVPKCDKCGQLLDWE